VILIDEPELHLHPEWQRKYIKVILDAFKYYVSKGFKFHFIIATHSPYILTDIPVDNIVFLDHFCDVSDEVKKRA